jgi:hypothetical protein
MSDDPSKSCPDKSFDFRSVRSSRSGLVLRDEPPHVLRCCRRTLLVCVLADLHKACVLDDARKNRRAPRADRNPSPSRSPRPMYGATRDPKRRAPGRIRDPLRASPRPQDLLRDSRGRHGSKRFSIVKGPRSFLPLTSPQGGYERTLLRIRLKPFARARAGLPTSLSSPVECTSAL